MSSETAKPRNKNWLLVKFREWHSWGGLFLSVFILIVAVTGILLNHKDLLLHGKSEKKIGSGLLSATTDLETIPISFARAMELAKEQYGDTPLEKIELKDEHGVLIYKVAKGEGEEIRINATTGDVTSKYGKVLAGRGKGELNWGKIVDDLHTGKIFGTAGKLTVDLTSIVIILLTLSGIYLWAVPWLRKRKGRKRRAENPLPVARPAVRERQPVEVG
ncbi:MAG TPA: PepSY-associated TM helix domain-containing protein [Caulifigura sp.]|jgi:uncharacterized iron-regulated membrane protein|nr:PepSY-associated TM helix domain-containing protein [Caulifigura sp.]